MLENLTVFFGPERTWLYDHFGFTPALEGDEQVDATFQLRGGWELNGHLERDFVNFQDSTYAGVHDGERRPARRTARPTTSPASSGTPR